MVNEIESQASILVVDDEAGMREGCRRVLTPAGYSVDTAAELNTALDLVQSGEYDLYLLDVMPPDGSGLDLLTAIIQHDPNAICIIILRKVCDLFRPQAREKGQNLQVEILDNPFLVADRNHLEQIWTNLVSNAIKYTPEGGRIEVTLQSEENSIIGTVVDSGIGIADDDRPRLFEDFFRTDEAKESGEIGTGLGLSIVKQTVESYGGEISVTSRLRHGSRFTFILPRELKIQEVSTTAKRDT